MHHQHHHQHHHHHHPLVFGEVNCRSQVSFFEVKGRKSRERSPASLASLMFLERRQWCQLLTLGVEGPGWKNNGHTKMGGGCCCFVLSCLVLLCFVLSCFVLSCLVLFCFALFCFVLSCLVLLCFVLSCFALLCFVLFCLVLSCLALLCFVLFCLVLSCFALLCFVLFCLVLSCFALLWFVLFCLVLFCFALLCFVLSCCFRYFRYSLFLGLFKLLIFPLKVSGVFFQFCSKLTRPQKKQLPMVFVAKEPTLWERGIREGAKKEQRREFERFNVELHKADMHCMKYRLV